MARRTTWSRVPQTLKNRGQRSTAATGEGYQVRTSAPSCRVRLLEHMEQLDAPYANLAPAARRALLEELVRRRFKWPRPFRDVMLGHFDRWTTWRARRTASCSQ